MAESSAETIIRRCGVAPFFMFAGVLSCFAQPSVQTIIQRSVEANDADWKAAPSYSNSETDRQAGNTKTYDVMIILGSPYRKLVAINGDPISPAAQKKEQQKLQQAIGKRKSESPQARSQRIAKYEKERSRDHLLLDQLTKAFNFKLAGESSLDGYNVYELHATPRPGYQPPNMEAQVLPGMRGTLWIDKKTFQWVKVEAEVVHPVSIAGFLARVEPGTRFELEKMPVAEGIWLPKHFAVKSRSKILDVFNHRTQVDEVYSNYHKDKDAQVSAALSKK